MSFWPDNQGLVVDGRPEAAVFSIDFTGGTADISPNWDSLLSMAAWHAERMALDIVTVTPEILTPTTFRLWTIANRRT